MCHAERELNYAHELRVTLTQPQNNLQFPLRIHGF